MFNRGTTKRMGKKVQSMLRFWTKASVDVLNDRIYQIVENADYDKAQRTQFKDRIVSTVENEVGDISSIEHTVSKIDLEVKKDNVIEGFKVDENGVQMVSENLTFNSAKGTLISVNNIDFNGYELVLGTDDGSGNFTILARKIEVV